MSNCKILNFINFHELEIQLIFHNILIYQDINEEWKGIIIIKSFFAMLHANKCQV